MANFDPDSDIINGKKGEAWIIKWEREDGSPKLEREIILRRNITQDIIDGKKPLKYFKDGKKEEIPNINKIKGLEWYRASLPRLKQSSSPMIEPTNMIVPIHKGKIPILPPISPLSPSKQIIPKLSISQDVSLPLIQNKSKSRGGFRKTKRKRQYKSRKTRRRRGSC